MAIFSVSFRSINNIFSSSVCKHLKKVFKRYGTRPAASSFANILLGELCFATVFRVTLIINQYCVRLLLWRQMYSKQNTCHNMFLYRFSIRSMLQVLQPVRDSSAGAKCRHEHNHVHNDPPVRYGAT